MIYLHTINSNFLSDLKTACCARGLDFAEFHDEDFIPSKKLTNVFVAEKSSPEQIGGNEEIYAFLKTHFFKRAVFIKLNCSHFSVIEHLNGAILEVQIPIEYSSSSKEVVYFIHYVIELIASEKANLPCADPQTASLVKLFQKISDRDVTVLVNGPTGTGKEVVSNLLHSFSNRNEGPFIAINCAAIPEDVVAYLEEITGEKNPIELTQQEKINIKAWGYIPYSTENKDIDKMPNQKWHQIVSFIKSGVRIIGYCFIPFNLVVATILLVFSEIIGIVEEMV